MKKATSMTILLFFITLTGFGCATTKPLIIPKEELVQRLNNSIVHIAVSDPSSFEDRARKAGLFESLSFGGALGASGVVLKNIVSGKELAKHFNLADPSLQVKNRFHDVLKRNYSIPRITNHPDPIDLKSIIQKTSQKSNVMVFIYKTSLWGLFCYPKDCFHTRVGYEVQAELYNPNKSLKIWSGKCKTFSPSNGIKYTKQELLEHSGAKLKEELSNAANYCADLFERELFTDNQ